MLFGDKSKPTLTQANPQGDWVKDGSDQDFMQDVIEPSKEVPVLVDFWAPWCGPCRQLGPIIEKAVLGAQGKIKLVKINIDEHPGIAGQLRVQSIPAVFAFQNGQPVDGFMGALPESQIKDFINRLTGEQDQEAIEALIARADEALLQGDLGGAAQDYATVLQADPENPLAFVGMVKVNLANGDHDQAQQILDSATEAQKKHPAVISLLAALSLKDEVADAPDLASAQSAVDDDPNSASHHYDLAGAYIAAGDLAKASDHLLTSISLDREWEGGKARLLLLKVFDAAGPSSEIAKQGRRKLSSLLFS
ncbi:thioredoxin [Woodsholea maritima]|uniref:thioredoxin n=1 Tax=Woodsholea maritima TaxID=240237 RepID=UPI000374A235|nr:thioredoxin [Woodsholea maritima]